MADADAVSNLGILHADLDAFFAAVEVIDDPSLAGKPLIIGHPGRRGVVSTASYEARRFGVGSAMPSVEAMRRCPGAIWRAPRGGRYSAASREVMAIFRRFSPVVEPLSLDEAFLDVAGSRRLFGTAVAIAEQIRAVVRSETGLVVSIGVAENKFLAKVASDLGKPDALTVVPEGGGARFLAPLPLRRLWGVGPRTAERLLELGLRTIGDLQRLEEEFLARRLGESSGRHLFRLAQGLDSRQVESGREAKSISTESTFATDIRGIDEVENFLFAAATEVGRSLRKEGWLARTVELKVRTGSFRTWTRSRTLVRPTDLAEDLFEAARELFLERIDLDGEGVRLLGVGGSGLVPADVLQQETLFPEPARERADRAERLVDQILAEQGRDAIGPARLLRRGKAGPQLDPDRPERQRPDVRGIGEEGVHRAPTPPPHSR